MKELWGELDPSLTEREKEELLKNIANLCDAILARGSDVDLARKMAARKVASEKNGDIQVIDQIELDHIQAVKRLGKQAAVRVVVRNRGEEDKALKAAENGADYVIVACPNWKIIPLENLIARMRGKSRLMAETSTAEETKAALESLELGVDGVILKTRTAPEFHKVAGLVKKVEEIIQLVPVKIVEVRSIESGARVCVDTIDMMKHGEGLLVGCQSSALFLVQAEVYENPHVEPRPFRVNAGPVALYVLTPGNKTKYLAELKAGDQVLIVDRNGRVRTTSVGRVKIEQRPFMLVEAEHRGRRIKTIMQNAETIRLVAKDGTKAVTDLKPGDEVLVRLEEGGRHFGTLVKEETVIEK